MDVVSVARGYVNESVFRNEQQFIQFLDISLSGFEHIVEKDHQKTQIRLVC
jgi:hypothetical protein